MLVSFNSLRLRLLYKISKPNFIKKKNKKTKIKTTKQKQQQRQKQTQKPPT